MARHGVPIRKPMPAPDRFVSGRWTSRCTMIQITGVAHRRFRLVAQEVHHSRARGSHERHQRLHDDGVEPVLRAGKRQTETALAPVHKADRDLRAPHDPAMQTLVKEHRRSASGCTQTSARKR